MSYLPGHSHDTASTRDAATQQVQRMQTAIDTAVSQLPAFIRHDIDSTHMAQAMTRAVRSYFEQEHTVGSDCRPHSDAARLLQTVLDDLMGCGAGHLAGRCDGDYVRRTMKRIAREYGTQMA
ncbi:MAG TPA: hypothetical protein VFQ88_05975 [Nevskiaceae bacterium]|nr:hypothetical protein [Nevskiaceae bacterium]